jgi:CheY-like chemotaxis protein
VSLPVVGGLPPGLGDRPLKPGGRHADGCIDEPGVDVAPHILVVEDSPLIQRLVAVCLRSLGRPIVEAADGPSAIESVLADPPGLVILDIGLPGIDGWQVLDRIRREPRVATTPVLVLTAHAQEEFRIQACKSGADAFMTKPFEPDDLRTAVEQLLAGERAAAAE